MSTLSSPNRVVWEYFFSLRQLVQNAKDAPSEELSRQSAALAIIMSVTVFEVFMNIWFRVRIEELNDAAARESFLKDLAPPRFLSLEKKLMVWPKKYLGSELELTSGPGKAFLELKRLRNQIIHFTSTHESFHHENVSIHGLADTSEYDALGYNESRHALETAENLIAEIFHLAGISSNQMPGALHTWIGKFAV